MSRDDDATKKSRQGRRRSQNRSTIIDASSSEEDFVHDESDYVSDDGEGSRDRRADDEDEDDDNGSYQADDLEEEDEDVIEIDDDDDEEDDDDVNEEGNESDCFGAASLSLSPTQPSPSRAAAATDDMLHTQPDGASPSTMDRLQTQETTILMSTTASSKKPWFRDASVPSQDESVLDDDCGNDANDDGNRDVSPQTQHVEQTLDDSDQRFTAPEVVRQMDMLASGSVNGAAAATDDNAAAVRSGPTLGAEARRTDLESAATIPDPEPQQTEPRTRPQTDFDGWACGTCTLHNPRNKRKCQACGTSKASSDKARMEAEKDKESGGSGGSSKKKKGSRESPRVKGRKKGSGNSSGDDIAEDSLTRIGMAADEIVGSKVEIVTTPTCTSSAADHMKGITSHTAQTSCNEKQGSASSATDLTPSSDGNGHGNANAAAKKRKKSKLKMKSKPASAASSSSVTKSGGGVPASTVTSILNGGSSSSAKKKAKAKAKAGRSNHGVAEGEENAGNIVRPGDDGGGRASKKAKIAEKEDTSDVIAVEPPEAPVTNTNDSAASTTAPTSEEAPKKIKRKKKRKKKAAAAASTEGGTPTKAAAGDETGSEKKAAATSTSGTKRDATATPSAQAQPPAKKKKVKKRTFQDDVYTTMLNSCKPYTLKTLSMATSSTEQQLNYVLLTLVDKDLVRKKDFPIGKLSSGKVKTLYWANQSAKSKEFQNLQASEEEMMVTRTELGGLQQKMRSIATEMEAVTSEPTNTELDEQVKAAEGEVGALQKQIAEVKERIRAADEAVTKPSPAVPARPSYGGGYGRFQKPPEPVERDPRKLKKKINAMREEWRKRKSKCVDFCDNIADAMEKSRKETIKLLGIETDEADGVAMPPKHNLD